MRLQLNILLKPVEGINLFRDVQEVMFPVLWFESLAELPEGSLDSLDILLMLPNIIEASSSIIIVIVTLIIVYIIKTKDKENASNQVKQVLEDTIYREISQTVKS